MYSMIIEPAVRPAVCNTACALSYSVLRQGIPSSCAVTLSHLDYFSIYNVFFLGWVGGKRELGILGRKLLHLKYPR